MNGLLTDLYELTMAAGYFEAGKAAEIATFEFAIRRLPPNRNYVLAGGLRQAVDYLLVLSFTAEEIDYCGGCRNSPARRANSSITSAIFVSRATCLRCRKAHRCSRASLC